METFEIIRALRISKNLSQDELAKKVGYTDRSSIAKIESGKVDLPESKIILFSKVLGVTPAVLMGMDTRSEWERRFLDSLQDLCVSYDRTDMIDACIDVARIDAVLGGEIPLDFDTACSIADELGESLDTMLRRENIQTPPTDEVSGVDSEIINLLLSLPESAKQEALSYIQFLSSREEK